MVKAYSLISCDPGMTSEIFDEVKEIEGVQSVEAVAGPYDMIANIEAKSLEKLTGTVFGNIRGVDGVTSTTTLIVVDIE